MGKDLLDTTDVEASVYGVAAEDSATRIDFVPNEGKAKSLDVLWRCYEGGKRYRLLAAVREEEGEFISYCLSLPGAVSCGDTAKEALESLREAVAGCILSYRDVGQEIPWTDASGSKDEYDSAEWIDVDV